MEVAKRIGMSGKNGVERVRDWSSRGPSSLLQAFPFVTNLKKVNIYGESNQNGLQQKVERVQEWGNKGPKSISHVYMYTFPLMERDDCWLKN